MLLNELFSKSIDEPKKFDPEVDYLDDLKFWISNNDEALSKMLMPAIYQHRSHPNEESNYKLYIKPLAKCAEDYCVKFDLMHSKDEIFTPEAIVSLAKKVAEEQNNFIHRGDYNNETI